MSQTRSVIWRQISAGALLLLSVVSTSVAQNGPPPGGASSDLVFPEVPAGKPQIPASAPDSVENKNSGKTEAEEWDDTPLRDPFWPVGYFPEGWQTKSDEGDASTSDGSGWKAAAAKIRVSGTSLMDGKTAAIVNGKLKVEGDLIEISHEGRVYQWLVASIDARGQIHLKKQRVK